ncbi:MAG: glycosyltransferase family 2 protein, partial [Gemmataceae bacterium]
MSVVINTYNRGPSLRETILALRHQTYDNFEVIVINGPSTDNSPAVVAEFADWIRAGTCPLPHLSLSRNIGIAAASGEIVAFIDDDGIPEPQWLEQLVAAYTDAGVGGVGGLVYDYTGYQLQYRYAVCDRRANARWDIVPPLTPYHIPHADPFIYLQGTNASFRRSALVEIGGFDEEIEYYLDETEVCMQLNDRGYRLLPLDAAIVHHKFLASHLRNDHKVLKRPYPVVKNKYYFALRNARATGDLMEVVNDCERFSQHMINDARWHYEGGRLSQAEFDAFQTDVARAVRDG